MEPHIIQLKYMQQTNVVIGPDDLDNELGVPTAVPPEPEPPKECQIEEPCESCQ